MFFIIHMFSIRLSLLIVLSVNIIIATNLRCNEDISGSFQVIENCRACVIFIAPAITSPTPTTTAITTKMTTTAVLPRNMFMSNVEPSIEELFLFDEKKRRRRRRRQNADTVIHQQCAREIDGPLYGFDQTHCYCNSNQCNSNIQRCIYEVTSKRNFACYHGTNSSQYPLEIRDKCRSCRIRTEFNSFYHYECLTFGEREQNNQTLCTCQRPMCNQDASTCQRFQQIPSQPRTNLMYSTISNSTTLPATTIKFITTTTSIKKTTSIKLTTSTPIVMTTTTTTPPMTTTTSPSSSSITTTEITTSITTTLPMTTTPIETTFSTVIETDEELSTENSTLLELTTTNETTTSLIEIKHLKTVYIEVKNHANDLSSNLYFNFYSISNIFISLYLFDVITSSIS